MAWNNQTQDRFIPVGEIAKNVGERLSDLDDERAVALDALLLLRKAKANTLVREYNRLLNVLGPNHPRSVKLLNQIDVNRSLTDDLSAEAVRARTNLPSPNANAWTVCGFVRDKRLRGVANLNVAFFTPNGNEAKEFGSAKTNDNGYFWLGVDGALITKFPLVHARVLDTAATTLHTDDTLLQPKVGSVDYREMVIA